MNGKFLISLDFELAWGFAGWNLQQIESYKNNLKNAKTALVKIVQLLEKYDMKCTIGYVGAMDYSSVSELEQNVVMPSYTDQQYASFCSLVPETGKEIEPELLLAKAEIEYLKSKQNVELGSHTYSHYYCLEGGQTISDFEKDMAKAQENARKNGIELKIYYFPTKSGE